MSLFEELKRRNVFRVGIAYAVTAWLLLQVADIVLQNIDAPGWLMKAIMLLLAIGFPLALLFAWAFELTPEGLKKEKDVDRTRSITQQTGRKLDRTIIVIMALALGYFAWDKFLSPPAAGIQAENNNATSAGQTVAAANREAAPKALAGGPPEKSIAVLPFVNMSNDPDQEFFSDGISEELLNVLAKYPGLRVAARTSSFQFKGKNLDIGEIARLLKVKHVLEGSVRKSGSKLRITAQLIQADTGYHLWSQTYDRELTDVFAIQDEISAAIGEALKVELALGPDQPQAAPRVVESSNTAAYEAYLRGRHLVNQRGRSNMTAAVEDLKRAVRLDPDFAPAHAWLAIAYCLMLDSPSSYGDLSLSDVRERATPHIEKALALDPELAEAHAARGLLANNSNDLELGMKETGRALELNPVYVDAMNWRQIAAAGYGDYLTSLEIQKHMVEADPLSIIGRLNYAPLLAQKDIEAGREMARGIVKQNAWAGYTALGQIEYQSGRNLAASLDWFMRAYGEDSHDAFSNRYLILILSLVGEYEEARRISDSNLQIVDIKENQLESAIHTLRLAHEGDPGNYTPMADLADALYFAGHFDEALNLYKQLKQLSPAGVITDSLSGSTRPTLRLAFILKRSGDELAARKELALQKADQDKRLQLGPLFFSDYLAEAMAHSIEGDAPATFASIRKAIEGGFRDDAFFREPALQWLARHPEFIALKAEVDQQVALEHKNILQLICHENPIPNMWQPMDKTCTPDRASS